MEFLRIKSVGGRTSDDGALFGLMYKAVNGADINIALTPNDAARSIGFFVQFLQECAAKQAASDLPATPSPSTITTRPIEARGIGLAAGRSPGETLFVVDLGVTTMTFAVPVGQTNVARM